VLVLRGDRLVIDPIPSKFSNPMPQSYGYTPVVSDVYRNVRRIIERVKYRGDAVYCPVCDKSFSNWWHNETYGMCPYCRSCARHRFMWVYMQRVDGPWKKEGCKMLLFAPDWGIERQLRRQGNIQLTTADICAPEADLKIDITAMALPDGSFDGIICSHVLEHVPDDHAAFREMRRILRPGGSSLVMVPLNGTIYQSDEDPTVTDPEERHRRFGQFDHVRRYGLDIQDRAAKGGFAVKCHSITSVMSAEEMKRMGLWEDVIVRCDVPV
jgi:SAM-dependent methyltransferase